MSPAPDPADCAKSHLHRSSREDRRGAPALAIDTAGYRLARVARVIIPGIGFPQGFTEGLYFESLVLC